MQNYNTSCPECGCSKYTTVHRKETFDLPGLPGEMELSNKLTVRYPLAKCSICEHEYRNKNSFDTVSEAVKNHIESKIEKFVTHQWKKDRSVRLNWIGLGVVLGSLFAHSLNLFLRKEWMFGSILIGFLLGTSAMIFFGDFVFRIVGASKSSKSNKSEDKFVVDDDFMNKLIEEGEKS